MSCLKQSTRGAYNLLFLLAAKHTPEAWQKKFTVNIVVLGKWRVSWYYNEFPTGCCAIVRVMNVVETSLMIVNPAEIEFANTKQSKSLWKRSGTIKASWSQINLRITPLT